MAMALALNDLGDGGRDLYLYDTFCGMTAPTDEDVSGQWGKANDIFSKAINFEGTSGWCRSHLMR